MRVLILDPNRPDFWTVGLETADLRPGRGSAGRRGDRRQRTAREERRSRRVRHGDRQRATKVAVLRQPAASRRAAAGDAVQRRSRRNAAAARGRVSRHARGRRFGDPVRQRAQPGASRRFPHLDAGRDHQLSAGAELEDAAYARAQLEERRRGRGSGSRGERRPPDAGGRGAGRNERRRVESARRTRELAESGSTSSSAASRSGSRPASS